MSEARIDRKKGRTVAWLADIYFREGAEAARSALEALAPGDPEQDYRVVRKGEHAIRTDVDQQDRIRYESFNPAFWDWPYSVLRVHFDPSRTGRYMHHGGEEILLPISGQVAYHFFWSPGRKPPREELLPQPLEPGSIIRINPQVPHHTWAAGRDGAVAWMLIRDLADSTAATNVDLPRDLDLEVRSLRRQLEEDHLKDSAHYALVAWGIAETIRLRRVRSGIRVRELAAACEIDPAQLSRIENGTSNASLDTLFRIARRLGIDFRQLLPSESPSENKPFRIEKIRPGRRKEERPVLCQGQPRHLLHPTYLTMKEGQNAELPRTDDGRDPDTRWSWIVLSGEVIFELSDSNGTDAKELLERESVLHCRNDTYPRRVRALQRSEILQITYSHRECTATP